MRGPCCCSRTYGGGAAYERAVIDSVGQQLHTTRPSSLDFVDFLSGSGPAAVLLLVNAVSEQETCEKEDAGALTFHA